MRSLVRRDDTGGAAAGFMLAIILLALVGVGLFFYFGGDAEIDADVNPPAVDVSTSPAPEATTG